MKAAQYQISSYTIRFSERNYKNANTFYLYLKSERREYRYSANTLPELQTQFFSSYKKVCFPIMVIAKIQQILGDN